jgi:uncharacterized membrane protein
MVVLAGLIYLPKSIIFSFGILLVFGHNLLDPFRLAGNSVDTFLWSALHQFNAFQLQDRILIVAYPMVPWIGVMALGYCFGSIYSVGYAPAKRQRTLVILGSLSILLFVVVRFTNLYGDPLQWTTQSSFTYTFLSFLNVTKYPPSLLYLLITLGPALLFLAATERLKGKFAQMISTYGRVPLFYYLLHIYLLHLVATVAAMSSGYQFEDMVFTQTWITEDPDLKGYGFSLPVVYLIWLTVIALLYPLCRRYDVYKQTHKKDWWLSYL